MTAGKIPNPYESPKPPATRPPSPHCMWLVAVATLAILGELAIGWLADDKTIPAWHDLIMNVRGLLQTTAAGAWMFAYFIERKRGGP